MIVNAVGGDLDGRESITESIIDCVAHESGRDSFELPPLWNSIDPEALESLFASTRANHTRSGRVEFTYCGYSVTVEDGEEVTISLEEIERPNAIGREVETEAETERERE